MRWGGLKIGLVLASVMLGGAAQANCAVIHWVDEVHTLQARLAAGNYPTIFSTDVRRLRRALDKYEDAQVFRVIGNGPMTARGALIRRFLADSRTALRQVSIDAPGSIQPHFANPDVQVTMQATALMLDEIRCTPEQIIADGGLVAETTDEVLERQLREGLAKLREPRVMAGLALLMLILFAAARISRALVSGK